MQPLVREGKSGYISNARAAFFRCHALHFSNAARTVLAESKLTSKTDVSPESLVKALPIEEYRDRIADKILARHPEISREKAREMAIPHAHLYDEELIQQVMDM